MGERRFTGSSCTPASRPAVAPIVRHLILQCCIGVAHDGVGMGERDAERGRGCLQRVTGCFYNGLPLSWPQRWFRRNPCTGSLFRGQSFSDDAAWMAIDDFEYA